MKKILLCAIAALAALCTFTSCEKEEEVALNIAGTWETSAALFPRTYKGETLKTTKTILCLYPERKGLTVGEGVAVEYYDNAELPVAYFHLKWETWTRKSGEVGIQVKYSENGDTFSTIEYELKGNSFSGHLFSSETTFSFTRGTEPDVKDVMYWGYNELLPTWHRVTYEGKINIKREYQGQSYEPSQIVITFDVDPVYNTAMIGMDKAFIKEVYEGETPWGTMLADSIRSWNRWSEDKILRIYRADSKDPYETDYYFFDVEFTDNEMKGNLFIKENVFEPFTLRRTSNPDWSTIKEWGFTKWF